MFMNTLNLLIGMSENALSANVATSSANEATIEEASETKPEPKNDEDTNTAAVEPKPEEKWNFSFWHSEVVFEKKPERIMAKEHWIMSQWRDKYVIEELSTDL